MARKLAHLSHRCKQLPLQRRRERHSFLDPAGERHHAIGRPHTVSLLDEETLRRYLQNVGRLKPSCARLLLDGDEILLPNHRDSLIAKTAAAFGRSVVWVPKTYAGVITSDRFTALRSKIDPRLLIVILNSRSIREQLVLRSRGSASFDIRDKVLSDVFVPRDVVTDGTLAESISQLWRRREELRLELKNVSKELQRIIS